MDKTRPLRGGKGEGKTWPQFNSSLRMQTEREAATVQARCDVAADLFSLKLGQR